MVRLSLLLAPCALAAVAPMEDDSWLSLLQTSVHKGHKKEALALSQLASTSSSTERGPGIIQSIQKISPLSGGDPSTEAPKKDAAPMDPLQNKEFQKLVAEMNQGKPHAKSQALSTPLVEKQEAVEATQNSAHGVEAAAAMASEASKVADRPKAVLTALPSMTIFGDQLKVVSEGEADDRIQMQRLGDNLAAKFESVPQGREVLGGGGGDRPTMGDMVTVTVGKFAGRTGRILADDKDLWPYTVEGLPGLFSEEQLQKVIGSQAASAAPSPEAVAPRAPLDAIQAASAAPTPDTSEAAAAVSDAIQATRPTTPPPSASSPATAAASQEATPQPVLPATQAARELIEEAAATDAAASSEDDGSVDADAEADPWEEGAAAESPLEVAAPAASDEASALPVPQSHLAADAATSQEASIAEANATATGVSEAKATVMGLVQHRLNQAGYKTVADLRNTETMATFIRLVVEANGGSVLDEQALRAFAAYHSGERGTQNFSRLLGELKTEPWNSVAGVPAPTDRFAPFTATLDVDGFNFVAAQKDAAQMLAFVTRFISASGGAVLDLDKLVGFCRQEVGSEELSFESMLQQLKAATWLKGMEPREKEPLVLLEESVSEGALRAALDPMEDAVLSASQALLAQAETRNHPNEMTSVLPEAAAIQFDRQRVLGAQASNESAEESSNKAQPVEEVSAPMPQEGRAWNKVDLPAGLNSLSGFLGQRVTSKVANVLNITGGRVNQAAYMQVARLNDTEAMEAFIRLTIRANGGRVYTDDHGDDQLHALAPQHSGEKSIQNYHRLLNQLKAADWNSVGAPPRVGEDVALKATLDQEGYENVQDEHDSSKMLRFMKRVLVAYGATLERGGDRILRAFATYHSSEKHSFSFDELIQQFRRAPWVHNLELSPLELEERRLIRRRDLATMREGHSLARRPQPQPEGQ